MLSIANKKDIYDNFLPKVYSVNNKDIAFSCFYEAQFISVKNKSSVLPALILKYDEIGRIIDEVDLDHVSATTLTITIMSKAGGEDERLDGGQFINGQKLVEIVASQIQTEFNANFESSVDGVALGEPVTSVTDTSIPGSDRHVYAMQVEIILLYEEKKQ